MGDGWVGDSYRTPADDFVIATGKTISLVQFVEKVFTFFDLNWKDHVDVDDLLLRPSDIKVSKGDPTKAKKILDCNQNRVLGRR